MMHWSDFKKHVEKYADKNKSVVELKKEMIVILFYIVVLFSVFMMSTFMAFFSFHGSAFGFFITALSCGLLSNFFVVLLMQQSLYIFLRKQFDHFDKEHFDERMRSGDDAG